MAPIGGLRIRPRRRRFGADASGAAAVEFAIVALPFFALVFAIVETALVFFASLVLDNGVAEAGRLIRTGQVQAQDLDADAFRERVCAKTAGVIKCEDGIMLDVRTYPDFGSIRFGKPIDEDGNVVEDFDYQPGAGGSIVVVRAFYEWPSFVPSLFGGEAELANGNRLLAAATTFRNEPF